MIDDDVTKAIQAKSDQLNADDLIAGPITIKITKVTIGESEEQKISINFENDNRKPWKPCKTAARCLAAIWGPRSSSWVGMSCTIYRDETVKWAGAVVGGIRVSHMEGLTEPRSLMLARTRGQKSQVLIKPLQIITTKKTFIKLDEKKQIIDSCTLSDDLKEIWAEIKEECKNAQDYQALEELKQHVSAKAANLKKENANA